MSDETTLLSCPFCGGEAHVVSDYSSERDETRWSLWHECCEHDGESAGYGHALFPWFETPWYSTEAEAIAAWNARAERGTLTAEQVREAVEKHWHDLSAEYDMPEATALPEYSYDWQAIADELNARAVRTCECVSEYAESPFDGKMIVLHRCSECHELMRPHMLYCPNCGAKVVNG